MIITDFGVFTIDKEGGGMTLIEVAPDMIVEEIVARTEANFRVSL